MEKKNLVIGSLWIFLFTLLGFVLETKAMAGEEWKQSTMRMLWKTAHFHGAIFGILNISYGLLISTLNLKGRAISLGSFLAVLGALVFPMALFLGGINMKFAYAAPLGGIGMILAWGMMSYTIITKKKDS
jgi:uncharacterized membrane protein YgdD (TMEM256/DUF423 family)